MSRLLDSSRSTSPTKTTTMVMVPILVMMAMMPIHATAQNTTLAPSPADEEDAKTQSLAWWVLVLGAVVAFPLLIGSCYAMLMWQQKAMHDYKGKFEELLKALGENRRRTEQQLRRADKRRKRLEKRRRRELQALGIDVDVQEEEDEKDKDGGMSVYGVHVNDDGLVIAFGGNAEETEALENLTPHQIACMNLLKSSGPARDELRRGPMMPPAGNTYLEPPQTKKRKQRLLLPDDDDDDSSELDIDQFEIDRPYDSFTRARKEIVQRARDQGIRLPIKERYAEHGDGDNDLFMAAQASGVLDDGNINSNSNDKGGAVNFGKGGTQAGGFNASAAAASAGHHHGTEGMHSDPNMDPLSALALRSSALHSTLAGLRKSAPVKHSVDF